MLSVTYAGCHLCLVSFMLSVIIQSVIYAECHLRLVLFMLSVVIPSVIYADIVYA